MRNKKIVGLLIFVALLAGCIYLFLNRDVLSSFSEKSMQFVEERIGKRVNTSGPLRKDVDDEVSMLTVKGTISETNRHRQDAGLAALEENTLLNISAQKKVDDMFERQYFEHDAPTGEGAGDVVSDVGYEFIVVGENLALGNYRDDKVLVQAWMDSPGHRENILKSSYTQIGVAVGRGVFEGRDTWLAVQHFAKPISACPVISGTIKSQIDNNNTQLDELKVDLENRKKELEKKPTSQEESDEYNKKVDEYNALVSGYNSLLEATRSLVDQYNSQVQNFNQCAKD